MEYSRWTSYFPCYYREKCLANIVMPSCPHRKPPQVLPAFCLTQFIKSAPRILGFIAGALFFWVSNSFFFFFSFWCFIGLGAVFKFCFSFSLLNNKPLQKLLVQTTSIYVNKPHFHHHILPWSGWLWMLSYALGSGGGAWLLHSMSTASFSLLDAEWGWRFSSPLGPARDSIGNFTLSGSVSLPPDGYGALGFPNTPVTPEVGWK